MKSEHDSFEVAPSLTTDSAFVLTRSSTLGEIQISPTTTIFVNPYLCNRTSFVFGLPPGYDGGDCCECDCVNGPNFACGSPAFDPASCIDPDSLCFSGYVEAGTKTTVGVSANAFDTRPGGDVGDIGCMTDGCLPALVRDGDSNDNESRWSCARTLLPEGGGECSISFTFEDPQDIKAIQVAFWRRAVRSRTLKASIQGWQSTERHIYFEALSRMPLLAGPYISTYMRRCVQPYHAAFFRKSRSKAQRYTHPIPTPITPHGISLQHYVCTATVQGDGVTVFTKNQTIS